MERAGVLLCRGKRPTGVLFGFGCLSFYKMILLNRAERWLWNIRVVVLRHLLLTLLGWASAV